MKKAVLIFTGVFVVLLGIFTFADLPISMALYNQQNPFGIFFAAFGETPAMLVGAFCCAAMLLTRTKTKAWKNVAGILGYGVLMLLFCAMAGIMPSNYMNIPLPVSILLMVVYFAGALLLARLAAKGEPMPLRRASVVGVILVFAEMIVINIIKIFWGRMRMRIMDDPASQFTPWYLPQGYTSDDQYKSFPSGHSGNAAAIVWITLLPVFVSKAKGKEPLLIGLAGLWTAMVMFSRIIMGAHFASDTLMGASITVYLFFILRAVVDKYYGKKLRKV